MTNDKAARLLREAEWLRANGDFLSEALSVYVGKMESNAKEIQDAPSGGQFNAKAKEQIASTFREQKANGERTQRELLDLLHEVAEEELAEEKADLVTYTLTREQDEAIRALISMAPVEDSEAAGTWFQMLPDALKNED